MQDINVQNQDIQLGSAHIIKSKDFKFFDRVSYTKNHMQFNIAYKYYLEKNNSKDHDKKILKLFQERYLKYRLDWLESADKQYLNNNNFLSTDHELPNPLCVDIETASICDLGCPHCFREYIMTPDKIMTEKLYKKIIDAISKLDVPSIKLNWRGEPLLHPNLCEFITYAKRNKILDVIINTNATKLDEKMSEKIIKSGLDQIIFSFDGGTKETYDNMRPGRFNSNNFETIYNNIKKFYQIRKKLNFKFPTTKVQMVLTKDTRGEIDSFYSLFNGIVDDVTVIQYCERGGNVSEISEKNKKRIDNYITKHSLQKDTYHMVTANDKIYLSNQRKPCAQLFQRLMITYDGRVGMCCHDWGAQHCIGYVDKRGFEEDKVIKDLENSIKNNKKGFELLLNAKKPQKFNDPPKKSEELIDIWNGRELNRVRSLHAQKKLNEVEICKGCTFKDTYNWFEI